MECKSISEDFDVTLTYDLKKKFQVGIKLKVRLITSYQQAF